MQEKIITKVKSKKEVEIKVTNAKTVDSPMTVITLIQEENTLLQIIKNMSPTTKINLTLALNTEINAIDYYLFNSSHIFLKSENDIFIDIIKQVLTYDFSFSLSIFKLSKQFLLFHMTFFSV
jgi:hypothetical protein